MARIVKRPAAFMAATAIALTVVFSTPAHAQVTAFRQAIAENASQDDAIAAFYRARDFQGLWSGTDEMAQARRNALLGAFDSASLHGLPQAQFDPQALIARMQAADTVYERGQMDVELTKLFLDYARDLQSGILVPSQVSSDIKRQAPVRDRLETLTAFAEADPTTYIRDLAPQTGEYARLMRAKIDLEHRILAGGWGETVRASDTLRPGDTGPTVVELRNRLIKMGYMGRSVSSTYDDQLVEAVSKFQAEHGLLVDGVAGGGTLTELNVSPEERLQSVIVAMERERWLNRERGERHVWVNQADFTAMIIDDDIVTFETRAVIGANTSDRRSPEFSDTMEHMVINPSWYVPRSIVVGEYLPQLQQNPAAAGQLQIINASGQVMSRNQDFSQFTASSFPYSMKQPPGPGNALGTVKFMFPNRYNIYLHDTPSRSLFARESRAFSHGCIRLQDPHDFAYALLARQTDDPQGFFQAKLRTGVEQRVNLETPIPVHLDYRTAFTNADGTLQFRRDVYGRDRQIWNALSAAGVAGAGVQG
ncbi:L,D-transpeptidase family protein [Marivivens aquimaris]|uniref:L,D-transpeptidase family protein n=1 Tax=Marivivens aquimaris TaxID=2774876 RepID=UPI0018813EA0|nr:L,D-transpeptidase family protein [Marivivens aquimaris]